MTRSGGRALGPADGAKGGSRAQRPLAVDEALKAEESLCLSEVVMNEAHGSALPRSVVVVPAKVGAPH